MNRYTYAQVAIHLASKIDDDNLSISRGEYIQSILDEAEKVIGIYSLDEYSEDLEETVENYLSLKD